MTYREKRVLFSTLLAQLVIWINKDVSGDGEVWEVTIDECMIHTPRWVRIGLERVMATDSVHLRKSHHYQGLAADLNLYVNGEYIRDGDHLAWKTIIAHWKSMHKLCTNGAGWNDANHFSLGEGL